MSTLTTTLRAEAATTVNTLAALTGRPFRVVGADEALAALRAGTPSAIAVVPWHERRDGRTYPTNQLVLRRVAGDRLHFEHPLVPGLPASDGDALGGPELGPLRRREADGADSMALSTFSQLMALGGQVLLPSS